MLERRIKVRLAERLNAVPAVALLGPRQVGKTTLAQSVTGARNPVYLDLESPADRDKLADPIHYLSQREDDLVILDEVQQVPELFATLRGLIDQGRRRGKRTGRFLLLGSASGELLHQSETLAGRISYLELSPLDVLEVAPRDETSLWVRGGFPESFLAADATQSLIWRQDFIRTYLERDIPQIGPRIPATTLLRLWTMLAHLQGGILNAANLARGLAVEGKSIARYLDVLVDLLLVRRLQPYQTNIGKRLVKSPKVFIRDSGVVHALLNIRDEEALLSHPVIGPSWEGFAIENLIGAAPRNTIPFFYRTAAGAEIDLLLDIPGHGLWAIEVKRGLSGKADKGFYIACDDLKPKRRYLVNAGAEQRTTSTGVEIIGLRALCDTLWNLK